MRCFAAAMTLYVGRLQTDIFMLIDNNGRIRGPAEEGPASSCWHRVNAL